MKRKVKSVWIKRILGIIGIVADSLISLYAGKSITLSEVSNAVATVTGDNNVVTINDIASLVNDYEEVKMENDDIRDLNAQYVSQLTQMTEKIDSLTSQIGDVPIINYQDLALSIDGENVPVNSKNSMVVIDSNEYVSKEIVEKLVDESQNVTYKNGTMYVGHIVTEKADLFEQWEVDTLGAELETNLYDSYGNLHQDALELYANNSRAVYNLNRKYSRMKLHIAMKEGGMEGCVGVITIKADDNIVYTSPRLSKTTEPFEVQDIAINNCSLLKVEYSNDGGWYNQCLIYEASVYN